MKQDNSIHFYVAPHFNGNLILGCTSIPFYRRAAYVIALIYAEKLFFYLHCVIDFIEAFCGFFCILYGDSVYYF